MDTNEKNITAAENDAPKKTSKSTSSKPKKSTSATKAEKKPQPKPIKDTDVVDVKSCCVGKFIWKSPKTGYKIIWDEFGTSNPMTVADLRDMRNGSRKCFENNWVVIEGDRAEDVLKFLQIDKYYKDFSSVDDVDTIFDYEPDEAEAIVKKFGPGLKELVARRAAALKDEGTLDSVKMLNAIEKATGYKIV